MLTPSHLTASLVLAIGLAGPGAFAGSLETQSNPVNPGDILIGPFDPFDINDRSDWLPIPTYLADPTGDASPELDYTGIEIAHDANNFYIHQLLAPQALPQFFGSRHNMFIDVDQDRTTGFIGDDGNPLAADGFLAIGAEFMFQGPELWAFTGGANQELWSWNLIDQRLPGGNIAYDDFPTNDVETLIPASSIGNPTAFDFVLNGSNSALEDYYPDLGNAGAAGDYFTYSTVLASLDGDYNGDGFVGIEDLNLVLGNWNLIVTPGNLLQGDGFDDPLNPGFIGIEDLNIVLGNWNAGTPPPPGSVVPEPTTLALLGLGGVALLRRHA